MSLAFVLCDALLATLVSKFFFHGINAGQFILSGAEGSHTWTLIFFLSFQQPRPANEQQLRIEATDQYIIRTMKGLRRNQDAMKNLSSYLRLLIV